jgi:DNA-binding NtrC family response regulator
MRESIVVVDANEERCRELRTILTREKFQSSALHSLVNLETNLQEGKCSRLFRNLKKTNPSVCIIGLSSRPFHPELEEAMSKYIHACLAKPVDEEELVYWVKSVCDV